jgi:hypothetical protein
MLLLTDPPQSARLYLLDKAFYHAAAVWPHERKKPATSSGG